MAQLESILIGVENFAALEQQYDMILQRINTFVDNASHNDVPKKTMALFFKELEEYIAVVDKELLDVQKKKAKAEKMSDKTMLGNFILTESKLQLVKHNFLQLLNKFRSGEVFDNEIIYQHNYQSLEDIHQTQQMVEQMEELIQEQQDWNSK
jgi:Spy/CpxP family protein refolding chaperone